MQPDGSRRRDIGTGFSGLFSPTGDRLAADDSDPCGGTNLVVARADGTQRHHIPGDYVERWLPDGRLFVSRIVGSSLRVLDARTRRAFLTVPNADDPHSLDISCSGRVAVVDELRGQLTLTVYSPGVVRRNPAPGIPFDVEPAVVTLGGGDGPRWSPDGRTLMFERKATSRSKRHVEIWKMQTRDWRPRRFSHPGMHSDHLVGWAPDGRRILFFRGSSAGARALVANADGSRRHVVYSRAFGSPLWSPDSGSVAFGGGAIVNATTGVVKRRVHFGSLGLDDWQALPGGPGPVRCADHVERAP